MIRLSIILTTFITLFYIGTPEARADCDSIRCVGKIERIYLDRTWVNISTDGQEANLNCTLAIAQSGGQGYVRLHKTHENYQAIYSTLLSAKIANMPVNIRISTGSADCAVAYVVLE